MKSTTIQQKFNHLGYIHDKFMSSETQFQQFFARNDIPLSMSSRISKHFDHHSFLMNDTICNPGDDQDRLYILVSGEIKLFDSQNHVIDTIDTFGAVIGDLTNSKWNFQAKIIAKTLMFSIETKIIQQLKDVYVHSLQLFQTMKLSN